MSNASSRDEGSPPQQAGQPDPGESVLTAVVNSFYPELVQSGRLAKERAQQMLSAVTVLSAALIAALVAGGANAASPTAKLAAVVAVVGWVIASGVLAWAATPRKGEDFPADMTAQELVRWVINNSASMEGVVESRLRLATRATVAALIVTLVSFGMYLFGEDTADWRRGEILFASGSVPALCGPDHPTRTSVDNSTLSGAAVRLRVACPDGSNREWRVARSAILAVTIE